MLARIGYFARETLISLRRNLLMTLAGVLTVAVSLALFGGILLLSRWVGHGTAKWKDGVELQIYMNADTATPDQVAAVREKLLQSEEGANADVRRFIYLSKQDAYEEFKRLFHDKPDLVQSVEANALPESFKVVPTRAELTNQVADRFRAEPGVDEVVTPDKSLKWLLTTTKTARWIFFGLSTALLVSSLFLIVNTIRLATFARRREIEVMKLVGASNSFVRIPFMAEGLVQGLLGAGIAFLGVFSLKLAFDHWFAHPSGFFQGYYLTTADAVAIGLWVIVLGAAIGLVGSFIGLWRFLRV